MKTTHAILVTLFLASTAFGQGTVVFNNKITGSVDARVVVFGGNGMVGVGSDYLGQLYASAPGGVLKPVGDPIPFRNTPDAGRGYLNVTGLDTTRAIPGVAEGGTAQVKMVAWFSPLGATYAAALAASKGGIGESAVFSVTTGGGLTPPLPLTGLQSFSIAVIPEPASAALLLLGGVVTGVFRRSRSCRH